MKAAAKILREMLRWDIIRKAWNIISLSKI
jgi:hypothetical protein